MVYYPTSCGVAEEAVFVVYRKTVKEIANVNIQSSCQNTSMQYFFFRNE